jgi:hypothetical protein
MPPIVQNPHSCNHCQKLLLKSPVKDSEEHEFDFSLTDILQAAAEQCSFCQWFLDDIVESPGWQDVAEKPETHEKLKLLASVYGFGSEGADAPVIGWFELSDSCYTKHGFALCTPLGEWSPPSTCVFPTCFARIQTCRCLSNHAR